MRWMLALLPMMPCLLLGEESVDPLAEALGVEPAPPSDVDNAYQAAFDRWQEGEQKLKDAFRKDLSKMIAMADEAQVFLLDFEMVKKGLDDDKEGFFYIDPYDSYSKILKSKKVEGDELAECIKAAAGFISSEDVPGAFCHFPIHGIRFKRQGELIYETSICWLCGNYFVPYPDAWGPADWVGFKDEKLKAFLDKVMPIPQSELDRFEKSKNPKKENK